MGWPPEGLGEHHRVDEVGAGVHGESDGPAEIVGHEREEFDAERVETTFEESAVTFEGGPRGRLAGKALPGKSTPTRAPTSSSSIPAP